MTEYIDREELMKFPIRRNHYDKEHGNEHFIYGIETVLEYAENLQAADVAPVRHGRWIENDKYAFGTFYDCSICGNRILDTGHSWNYCPNCGAKMDEVSE